MLSVVRRVSVATTPRAGVAKVIWVLPRSMYRYSSLALQPPPKAPFDAGAGGSSGLHVLEGRRSGPDTGDVDRGAVLDLAVSGTGRAVQQGVRRRQET